MGADSLRTDDTRAWLQEAVKDLRRIDVLLAADPPDPEDAPFHCQQAGEKALKAFLTWHDVPFRRVHELDELGSQCTEIDDTLTPLTDQADRLTKYASRFRYPGAPYRPTPEEARSTAALVRELLEAILSRLPAQVRPQPLTLPPCP